jgi:hypothetical protein
MNQHGRLLESERSEWGILDHVTDTTPNLAHTLPVHVRSRAGGEVRTRVSCLEGRCLGHSATPALMLGLAARSFASEKTRGGTSTSQPWW